LTHSAVLAAAHCAANFSHLASTCSSQKWAAVSHVYATLSLTCSSLARRSTWAEEAGKGAGNSLWTVMNGYKQSQGRKLFCSHLSCTLGPNTAWPLHAPANHPRSHLGQQLQAARQHGVHAAHAAAGQESAVGCMKRRLAWMQTGRGLHGSLHRLFVDAASSTHSKPEGLPLAHTSPINPSWTAVRT